MSTYRERRLAKAERLRDWADTRVARDSERTPREKALDAIPFGQPILVGHHSERAHRNAIDKADQAMRRRMESLNKAEDMASRADNIEAAAAKAIYSDDDDAAERLRERIAGLEAERERIKAFNASCRKGSPDVSLLDEAQRKDLETTARVCPYQLGKNGSMPAYKLQNLGGNITRNKKRLAQLERKAQMVEAGERGRGRKMAARYGGTCADCGATVERGDEMIYYRVTREVVCSSCE